MKKTFLLAGSLLVLFVAASLAVRACADEEIYRGQSEFTKIYVSEDGKGIRTLWFERGGARQSVVKLGDPDYLELPYAKAMHAGLAFCEKPERVLVVGLGGRTIPNVLRRHFPEMTIDVVDIVPVVVRVAKKYFGFREDEKMHAFVADGLRFIEKSDPVYDVIYLDAFSADSVPYSLSTREFLQAARKALKPGGVVLGNVWSSYSNALYHSMIRTYQDTFEHVAVVDVRGVGNKIVIAVPREKIAGKEWVAERAGAIALRAKFPYDLKELVEYGYQQLTEPDAEGEVLRDR